MKCNSQSNLRHNQILIWLCILSFFSVLNEMVLNVSLPDIANDFNKPPASTNWVNTAFMLTFSIGTAVYGKLSDQLGIKRLLLFGIIINCFGSVIGFVGHSFFSLLIMARFIQGAGAAAFPALVMVVVARYIPKENRGKAFGLIGSHGRRSRSSDWWNDSPLYSLVLSSTHSYDNNYHCSVSYEIIKERSKDKRSF